MNRLETIFALSSGSGPAGVAVIRISGPAAGAAVCALTRDAVLPPPREARLANLLDPDDGRTLDRGLVLWFPGPGSYTGEDVAELQVHGGPAVIQGVLGALARLAGLRLATAGEFTRRAVQHGRFDLVRAEGIGDLVAAETEAQRDQALRQVAGSLSGQLEAWRQRLVKLLAYLEADIDFGEEDLGGGLPRQVRVDIASLRNEIGLVLSAPRDGERLRAGYLVSILGPPNVGKSSLLNRLAGSDVAIVSARAGTTRDVVEARLVLDGLPVTFADTAGLRESADDIEQEGVRRARAHGAQSDLRIVVFDGSDPRGADAVAGLAGPGTIVVANKMDLGTAAASGSGIGPGVVALSALTGDGLDVLQRRVVAGLNYTEPAENSVRLTRARHRDALTDCHGCLARVEGLRQADLVAEEVRLAVRTLGRILGVVDVEDLLDIVFRDFCIGK